MSETFYFPSNNEARGLTARGDVDPNSPTARLLAYMRGAPPTAANVRTAQDAVARNQPAVGQSGNVAKQVEGPTPRRGAETPSRSSAPATDSMVDEGSFEQPEQPTSQQRLQPFNVGMPENNNTSAQPSAGYYPTPDAVGMPPSVSGGSLGDSIINNLGIPPWMIGIPAALAGGIGLTKLFGAGAPNVAAASGAVPPEPPNIMDYTQLPPEGNRFNLPDMQNIPGEPATKPVVRVPAGSAPVLPGDLGEANAPEPVGAATEAPADVPTARVSPRMRGGARVRVRVAPRMMAP